MSTNSLSKILDQYKSIPSSGGSSAAADVSYDNASSGLIAIEVQAALDELAASLGIGVHLYFQTERTTLTANRTLTNADKGILNVEVNNAGFNTLTLPAAPDTDRRFLIRNRPSSAFNLIITGQGTLLPGDLWEAVYDGVEWIVI